VQKAKLVAPPEGFIQFYGERGAIPPGLYFSTRGRYSLSTRLAGGDFDGKSDLEGAEEKGSSRAEETGVC
jgi:hypothetical protein